MYFHVTLSEGDSNWYSIYPQKGKEFNHNHSFASCLEYTIRIYTVVDQFHRCGIFHGHTEHYLQVYVLIGTS